MPALTFLVFINELFQFFAEDTAVIAAHLCAADKTGFFTLDADHVFLLNLLCYHAVRFYLMSAGGLVNDKFKPQKHKGTPCRIPKPAFD
jgi:hypothetical protein